MHNMTCILALAGEEPRLSESHKPSTNMVSWTKPFMKFV